jgi:hypothetical protein
LLSNLIGTGLGPLAVGVMSDALAPRFGEDSLRIALVIWTPGYLWAMFHVLRARRFVREDIESSRAEEQAAVMHTPTRSGVQSQSNPLAY